MLVKRGAVDSTGQLDVTASLDAVPIAGSATTADFVAVGGASAAFPTLAMVAGHQYVYSASTDSWIRQGAAGVTASKGAGSMFVVKGRAVLLDGAQGAALATLQDSAGGNASLNEHTV